METLKEKHKSVSLVDINRLHPENNYVICKRVGDNINAQTPAGIYKTSEMFHKDQFLSENVERIFEVIAVPDEALETFGFWKTTIDVKPGDRVIVSYLDSLNSTLIVTDEHEYRMIKYHNIITIVRGKKLIPVNGYLLFTQLPMIYNTKLYVPEFMRKRLDLRYGIIEEIAPSNEFYTKGIKTDFDKGIDVKKGDKVVFIKPVDMFAPPLEHEKHRTLKKAYRYCQRYQIGGKM